jgi:hypothetical protein
MNSFPQRLAHIMRTEGILNVAKLAEALGYDRSERVRKVMSGESLPSYGMLEDIARTFASVDLHWLITGVTRGNVAEPPPVHSHSKDDIIEAAREAARIAAREEFAALSGRKRTGPVAVSDNGAGAKD